MALRQNLGQVHGLGGGVLRDLLLAAKPIADDDRLFVAANGGEKNSLAEGLRDLVLVGFKSERTSHAAATGIEKLNIGSGSAQNLHLVLHTLCGVVMAVAMNDDLLIDLRRTIIRRMLYEELAEEESLIA